MKSIIRLLVGATAVLAASRTTTPTGCVHVAKSSGSFSTIQAAVNSLSTTSTTAQCIFIDQGTYNEQVGSFSLDPEPSHIPHGAPVLSIRYQ